MKQLENRAIAGQCGFMSSIWKVGAFNSRHIAGGLNIATHRSCISFSHFFLQPICQLLRHSMPHILVSGPLYSHWVRSLCCFCPDYVCCMVCLGDSFGRSVCALQIARWARLQVWDSVVSQGLVNVVGLALAHSQSRGRRLAISQHSSR